LSLKINSGFPAQNSRDHVFVEAGICLKAHLHGFKIGLTFSIFWDSSIFRYRPGFDCRARARKASNSRSCCRGLVIRNQSAYGQQKTARMQILTLGPPLNVQSNGHGAGVAQNHFSICAGSRLSTT
jgi:hypothetical protein